MKHYINVETDDQKILYLKNKINTGCDQQRVLDFAFQQDIHPPNGSGIGHPTGIIIDTNKHSGVETLMWEMNIPDDDDGHAVVTENQELNRFLVNAIFNGISEDTLVDLLKKSGINPPDADRDHWGLAISGSKTTKNQLVEWC